MDSERIQPKYYDGDGKITCRDAMRSMQAQSTGLSNIAIYFWGNAFKYLWRWAYKNGVEDLKKCKTCIDYIIEEMDNV